MLILYHYKNAFTCLLVRRLMAYFECNLSTEYIFLVRPGELVCRVKREHLELSTICSDTLTKWMLPMTSLLTSSAPQETLAASPSSCFENEVVFLSLPDSLTPPSFFSLSAAATESLNATSALGFCRWFVPPEPPSPWPQKTTLWFFFFFFILCCYFLQASKRSASDWKTELIGMQDWNN